MPVDVPGARRFLSGRRVGRASLGVRLGRRSEAERLSRPRVEAVLDLLDLGVRDRAEVGLLREVFPHKPVGMLVRAALPGMVGLREVEVRSELRRHRRLPRELLAVFRRERVHRNARAHCQLSSGLVRRSAVGASEIRKLRGRVDRRDDGISVLRADERVRLPVVGAGLLLDDCRVLGDVRSVRNQAASGAATALPVRLLPESAQMQLEVAARLAVGADISVDPLAARRRLALLAKAARNLLWAPAQLQLLLHEAPLLGAHLARLRRGGRASGFGNLNSGFVRCRCWATTVIFEFLFRELPVTFDLGRAQVNNKVIQDLYKAADQRGMVRAIGQFLAQVGTFRIGAALATKNFRIKDTTCSFSPAAINMFRLCSIKSRLQGQEMQN